jgi:hypothetical protein
MRRIIVPFLILTCASATLIGLSLHWQPAILASLPLTWPALIVLGADETTERYGVYGELARVWYCSLPVALAYATMWAMARRATRA